MSRVPLVVVKVGGSLFDLPELGRKLGDWLAGLQPARVVLVPGGGRAADAVRAFDRAQQLGEEAAHWLAVEAMRLNVALLLAVLRHSARAETLQDCFCHWERGLVPVLDVYPFLVRDDVKPDHLPHSWEVTSDSLAARVAVVWRAARLILLKSTPLPAGLNWTEAGRRGLVDPCFAGVVERGGLAVEVIDFRSWAGSSRGES